MYCEKCGAKNTKEDKFCCECGAKLVHEEKKSTKKTETKPVKQAKPMSKGKKISIALIIVLIVALFGGYSIMDKKFSPKETAKAYFESYMSKDADKLYSYLDVENKGLTSKKIFKEGLAKEEKTKITNYTMEETKIDNLSTSVEITYYVDGNSNAKTMTVKLVKDSKKKYILFDNWKISDAASNYLITDKSISVPKDTTVEIGGEKMNVDDSSSYYSYSTVKVDKMFNVEYPTKVTYASGVTLEGTYNPKSDTSIVSGLKLTQKQAQQMEKDLPDQITNYYDNAINKKSWDDIEDNYKIGDMSMTSYESMYSYIYYYISYNGLKSFDVTKVSIDEDQEITYVSNGGLRISADIEYDYKKDASYSSSSTEGTANSTITFDVGYKDGKYVIVGIYSYRLDWS